ncbi:MAG: GAF domain-containing protein [Bacteroidota bacterium]
MENTFGIPIIPENEQERLNALGYFSIINSVPDNYFDSFAKIIASAFDAPIALVSIVGDEDVFFRGNFGMPGTNKVSRGKSLCSLAILNPKPTVFKDALKEPCLLKNPLVIGAFGLRFYAGAPLTTLDGYNIGSVCIVDKKPREWSNNDNNILCRFAEVAMLQINTYYHKSLETIGKT